MVTVNRKLLSTEREKLILQALGNGVRTITELSQSLKVSEATVRRDLQSLEEKGKARRVHGGAEQIRFPRIEPLFNEKTALHAAAKNQIAELALKFIEDNDTVYLDGGSTVQRLAALLGSKRNLTVVTNSMTAAAELTESAHRLIILGGEFRALSQTLVGPMTAGILEHLNISKAFLGTIGFTVEEGISTTDPNEAFTKELVMKRSKEVFLLADSSKIGHPSFAVSGNINSIGTLITDPGIPDAVVRKLNKKNIKVVF
ncbi:MAG: DeoR/GlpR family DNA-binding transcription regulator [Victivallaceae bacterium]|jgi:DeoR/GlpR family transcriptional regulator of sugar metabolism|nr:DeoR/GlpR family DNA-binding transcription regulator [Victivallaceae bacterium]NLK83287.1 DeoR/GlpR transcriptional regulator [Lentisphaerota bacterium]MDD3117065.1 DeoR/GlpR family DNA-binding transcription regulator [Victivallaceae bacterium]MDD3703683.1 DeoR/GlpR family DNA-binding transcription regulator [Victivallaceae bacterium]MDD4317318.1 DeoR/GlpR family DNA-binding transcription regulator [Victivallaceae bacterium]